MEMLMNFMLLGKKKLKREKRRVEKEEKTPEEKVKSCSSWLYPLDGTADRFSAAALARWLYRSAMD